MAAEPDPQIDLPYLMEVARRVKAARGYANGMSQRELGLELGVDAGTVKRWEKGDVQLVKRIDTIARVCGLKPAFFTVDFDRLGELEATPSGDQKDKLRQLEDRVGELEIWRSALEVEGLVPRGEEDSEDPPSQHGQP